MSYGDAPLLRLLDQLARPRRRDLLRMGAMAAVAAGCGKGGDPSGKTAAASDARRAPDAAAPRALEVLTADEARVLDAATARILPSEPDFPGAREAGVVDFIDGQLATDELQVLGPAFKTLAQLLDVVAQARHKKGFAALDERTQDGILDELSKGTLPVKKPLPQAALFAALHTLTVEGYLADPKHGGNRGEVGWNAIGFQAPPLREPGGHHH